MENATKALLIAAGVLLAIMILSLLVMAYTQMSDYYQQKHENIVIEQTKEFNNQFESYKREQIRGSDMLSLMNKIIDYNQRLSYEDGTGYRRIAVTIEIGDDKLDQFKYTGEYANWNTNELLKGTITNTTGNSSIEDQNLVEITSTVHELSNYMGINLTDSDFQRLASNAANILLSNTVENSNTEYDLKTREKRAKILKNVGIDIEHDVNQWKPKNMSEMNKVKSITNRYYQYMQFKRAYFDCTEIIYDGDTGRIIEMNFKIRTNLSGMIEFN